VSACTHRRCEVVETHDRVGVVACIACSHQFRPDAQPPNAESIRYWERHEERLAMMRGSK